MLVGLINGSFYAMLSLGLAIIFGLLRIINFAHGAQYMLGAFVGYLLLSWLGIGYWPALILAPLIVGLGGAIVERVALSRLYNLDPLYGLLFTFGLALVIEGTFRYYYGAAGPMRCRLRLRADTISASCSCRTIVPGSSSPRSSSALAPGS